MAQRLVALTNPGRHKMMAVWDDTKWKEARKQLNGGWKGYTGQGNDLAGKHVATFNMYDEAKEWILKHPSEG